MPRPKRKLGKDSSSDEDNEVASKKARKIKSETKIKSSGRNVKDSTEIPLKRSNKSDRNKGTANQKSSKFASQWIEAEVLSEQYNTPLNTIKNIVQLFQEDNTIPFICRYRKELIGNVSADIMRDMKVTYNQLLKLKVKQETVITKLEKMDMLSDELHRNILAVKSSDELDHLYEPFKTASKTSLCEKAKSKGLQDRAEQILYGRGIVNLRDFVNAANGLEDVHSVREGIKHIILNMVNKDVDVLEEIRRFHTTNKTIGGNCGNFVEEGHSVFF